MDTTASRSAGAAGRKEWLRALLFGIVSLPLQAVVSLVFLAVV
ncbi:hypothetical protein [Streptomyces sasae]|nr:hypothetical protein [Streptomyces sasae]